MIANITSPSVLITLIICATIVYLGRCLKASASKELEEAVDQLVEDHGVFHAGLDAVNKRLDEQAAVVKVQSEKVNNLTMSKAFR